MKRRSQRPEGKPGRRGGTGRADARSSSPGSSADATRLPRWKKALFAGVACGATLVLLELALALAGIRPLRYERDPYVGFASELPLFVPDTAGDSTPNPLPRAPGARRITAPNKRHIFNLQSFPEPKPAGTTRIFCLGGSTTYGHPYDDATSFAGWLRAMLPVADPSRRWEVINCGGISYASYREALLMEELIRYQPDLFIVLTGQNEFLEQRTYGELLAKPRSLLRMDALLSRTRLYAVTRRLLEQAGLNKRGGHATGTPGVDDTRRPGSSPAARPPDRSGGDGGKGNVLPAEVETMLEHVVGPQAYHRDPVWQRQVMEHFRFNLNRMVDIGRSAGAPVWFIAPASNLRDCAPFKSEHRAGLSEADLAEWQRRMQSAAQAGTANQWSNSLAFLEAASQLDDQSADLHYLRGRVLWKLGRHPDAHAAFILARDLDVCPLRALSPMLSMVQEVASRGGRWIDFQSLLERRSQHGVPGEDWFLDHVHPTIEGNRQLALALLETMAQQGLAHPQASWNEAAAAAIERAVTSTLTPEKHGTALTTLAKVLAWAGKHEEAYRASLRAVQLAPLDAASQFEAGKNAAHLRRSEDARRYLQRALELRPGFVEAQAMLGSVHASEGNLAEAIRQCREAIQRRPEDPELHSNLGALLQRQGDSAQAIASFREAIRLRPDYAEAQSNLGWVLKDAGQFTEALAAFQAAHRLKPGLASPAIGLAFLLATHPDASHRDPVRAVELAERLAAQSEYRSWMSLDALAAAYAAAGRFPEAVRAAERALPIVRQASPAEAAAVENRLKLYQAGRAYRVSSEE